jgi:Sigma-70, region 4
VPRELADAHAQVEHAEAAGVLRAFLHALPPEQCEAYVLTEVHGLTGPELARPLGIPIDTAYSRVRAARLALARAIDLRRVRERQGPRMAALALVSRAALGVMTMNVSLMVPSAIVVVSGVAAVVQLTHGQGPSTGSDPGLEPECVTRSASFVAGERASACFPRRDRCNAGVAACRQQLGNCQSSVLEQMPLPLRFEGATENPELERRLDGMLDRVAIASGSELAAECRGEVCRIDIVTTDAIADARELGGLDAPQQLVQRDPGLAARILGASMESGIPSTDAMTGEGVWLESMWLLMADETQEEPR